MNLSTFLSMLLAMYSVRGLSFKAPITTLQFSKGGHDQVQSWKTDQKPIDLEEFHQNDRSAQLPVTKNLTHELGYFTNIGIGSPPQYFSVLLDISAADTFISSIKCDSCSRTNKPFSGYNSTASSTYFPNDTHIRIDYGDIFTTGILSQDTLQLGSLQIRHQLFQEALEVNGGGPSWDDRSIVHGVLGLTPSTSGSVQQISNPFINVVSQGLLDHNLFTLKLAEPGQLTIGTIDHSLFNGNLTRIPLTHNAGSFLAEGRWQVEAKYLAIGPYQEIKKSIEGYTATFTTMWPFIYLPDLLAYNLNVDLGFQQLMFLPPSIDCNLRKNLPDVTINLGGHDLVLSPYDYTIEWSVGRGQRRCVSTFTESELDEEKGKQVILGSAFLRKFYTVFDLDSKTVACKYTTSHRSSGKFTNSSLVASLA